VPSRSCPHGPLGHPAVGITLDSCSHMTPTLTSSAALRMDRLLDA
jgi:hypothetical protein